jgi:hypothetical protein
MGDVVIVNWMMQDGVWIQWDWILRGRIQVGLEARLSEVVRENAIRTGCCNLCVLQSRQGL